MQKLYVIDDFYSQPDAVRQLALDLEFETKTTPNYPGFQSHFPCVSDAVVNRFTSLVGGEIDWEWSKSQMGYFRYILESGKSRPTMPPRDTS